MQDRPDIPDSDFRLLFDVAPTPYVLLLPDDRFTIVSANQARLSITHTDLESTVGKGIFEVFPDNPDDPLASGVINLRASLERVVANRVPDTMAVVRYDIPGPQGEAAGFQERYWSAVNVPVLSPEGELLYILHRAEDITEFVALSRARDRERQRSESLEESNAEMAARLLNRSEQLNAANAELRRDAQRKDEFLAMLAHELRNPLAAIHNSIRLLERSPSERSERYFAILGRQADSLRWIVDDLLDVSRITRGLVELRREPVDLGDVARHAAASIGPAMDDKQHELAVVLPEEPVPVVGDPVRLEQILVNVLANAAKYTSPGGRIVIRLDRDGGQARLRVRDNGIGMSADVLEKIFDLFGQAERGLARAGGGLGIGLHIVKNLVELHEGSVEAYSDGPGQGAEFVLRFPLAAAAAVAAAESRSSANSRHGVRILLVEDSPDIAETLALLLEDSGHEVSIAEDGPSALVKAEELTPELILLDIGLPGMEGYEVAQRLRHNPRTGRAIMAAVTGYGQRSDIERSRAAGFDEHFTKPTDIEQLEAFIAKVATGEANRPR